MLGILVAFMLIAVCMQYIYYIQFMVHIVPYGTWVPLFCTHSTQYLWCILYIVGTIGLRINVHDAPSHGALPPRQLDRWGDLFGFNLPSTFDRCHSRVMQFDGMA
jgi:hypothetical protein